MGCIITQSAKQDRCVTPSPSNGHPNSSPNSSSMASNPTLSQTSGQFSKSSYRFVHKEVSEKILNQNKSQGIVGLKNLGNTCFMNSALQCLSNTIPLVDYFLGYCWREEINRKNPVGTGGVVAEQFGTLVSKMWDGSMAGTSISTSQLKQAIGSVRAQFRGFNQQDSHEFLAFLLDGLHEDLNRVINKPLVPEIDSDGKTQEDVAVEAWKAYLLRNRSVIVDIFQGQLRNILSCLACRYKSFTFDPFMYMTVPIARSGRMTLHDCLAEFCRPEILSLDCQWKCPKCKVPRDAEKKMDIWIAPPIFIVHLKRFEDKNGRRFKLDTMVDFPISNLDLSEFMGSNQPGQHIYELYGVINHSGSLAQGHYTSFAKNRLTNKWYLFNDAHVKSVKESDVCTKSAYVLFYNKVYIPDKNDESLDGLTDGEERNFMMMSGGMIKRQSISGPHYWPHVNDPSTPSRSSTMENPHFESLRLALATMSVAPDTLIPQSPVSPPCTSIHPSPPSDTHSNDEEKPSSNGIEHQNHYPMSNMSVGSADDPPFSSDDKYR